MDLELPEIDTIKQENADLLVKINDIEKILTEYRVQYQNNIEKIQSFCEHDFDKYIIYGERPTYCCKLCGVYR